MSTTSANAPIRCPEQRIEPAWIDYNGHLNMAYYHVLLDRGVDHAYDTLGIGEAYVRERGGSCFTRQVHVNYLTELSLDDRVIATFQLLDADEKRLHFFQTLRRTSDDTEAATSEQLAIHVDMNTRRTAPFPADAHERIQAMLTQHRVATTHALVGATLGIRRN